MMQNFLGIDPVLSSGKSISSDQMGAFSTPSHPLEALDEQVVARFQTIMNSEISYSSQCPHTEKTHGEFVNVDSPSLVKEALNSRIYSTQSTASNFTSPFDIQNLEVAPTTTSSTAEPLREEATLQSFMTSRLDKDVKDLSLKSFGDENADTLKPSTTLASVASTPSSSLSKDSPTVPLQAVDTSVSDVKPGVVQKATVGGQPSIVAPQVDEPVRSFVDSTSSHASVVLKPSSSLSKDSPTVPLQAVNTSVSDVKPGVVQKATVGAQPSVVAPQVEEPLRPFVDSTPHASVDSMPSSSSLKDLPTVPLQAVDTSVLDVKSGVVQKATVGAQPSIVAPQVEEPVRPFVDSTSSHASVVLKPSSSLSKDSPTVPLQSVGTSVLDVKLGVVQKPTVGGQPSIVVPQVEEPVRPFVDSTSHASEASMPSSSLSKDLPTVPLQAVDTSVLDVKSSVVQKAIVGAQPSVVAPHVDEPVRPFVDSTSHASEASMPSSSSSKDSPTAPLQAVDKTVTTLDTEASLSHDVRTSVEKFGQDVEQDIPLESQVLRVTTQEVSSFVSPKYDGTIKIDVKSIETTSSTPIITSSPNSSFASLRETMSVVTSNLNMGLVEEKPLSQPSLTLTESMRQDLPNEKASISSSHASGSFTVLEQVAGKGVNVINVNSSSSQKQLATLPLEKNTLAPERLTTAESDTYKVVDKVQASQHLQVIAPAPLPIILPTTIDQPSSRLISDAEIVRMFVAAADAVADAILVSDGFSKGEGKLIVQLHSDILNGSEVHIVAKGGLLTVIVNPATQDVQQIVEANRTQFEQFLAEKVHSLRVSVSVRKGGKLDERA